MSFVQSSLVFTIRALTPCDAREFQKIRIEAMKTNLFVSLFPPEEGKTPLEVESTLPMSSYAELLGPHADDGVFFGAYVGETLVGFANVRRCIADDNIEEAYLGSDYTSPDYRKNGIWKALLAVRLDHGASLGLDRASSCCRRDNDIVKDAFVRHGFVIKDIVTGLMPDGSVVEGYHMERPLLASDRICRPGRPAVVRGQLSEKTFAMGEGR